MDLTTRTVRRRLDRRHEPYWVRVARGRSLGYRRSRSGPGSWYMRAYVGKGKGASPYRRKLLGAADDLPHAVADGVDVLTYARAHELAVAWTLDADLDVLKGGPVTVAGAVTRYMDWYKEHRRSWYRVRCSLEAHVLPELGHIPLTDLTTGRIRRWHQALAKKPAHLRSHPGRPKNQRKAVTEDERRARKSTANRVLAAFKAALARAYKDGLVASDDVWRRVEPFRHVEASRTRYLDHEEIRRLLNVCEFDLRGLVSGALHTGARFAELTSLEARDFDPETGTVFIAKAKSGNPRRIYLNEEGVAAFGELTAGRGRDTRIFARSDGSEWYPNT